MELNGVSRELDAVGKLTDEKQENMRKHMARLAMLLATLSEILKALVGDVGGPHPEPRVS